MLNAICFGKKIETYTPIFQLNQLNRTVMQMCECEIYLNWNLYSHLAVKSWASNKQTNTLKFTQIAKAMNNWNQVLNRIKA